MPQLIIGYRVYEFVVLGPTGFATQVLSGNTLRVSLRFQNAPNSAIGLSTSGELNPNKCPIQIADLGFAELKRDVYQAIISDPWYLADSNGTMGLTIIEHFWIPSGGA